MLKFTTKGCVLFAVLLGGSFSTQAAPLEARNETVHYGDLDLNKPMGTEALYRRIVRAAFDVCRYYESRELATLARHQSCVDNAIDRAIAGVHRASLSYYAKEHGRLIESASHNEAPAGNTTVVLTSR